MTEDKQPKKRGHICHDMMPKRKKMLDPLDHALKIVRNTIGFIPDEILGYKFKDQKLLLSALTHTSFHNEVHPPWEHYQRLEFLGDAILEHISSEMLFKKYPDLHEGALTRRRAAMVQESAWFVLAQELNLSKLILLGRGEIELKLAQRPSVLSDIVEAICAAIYLDGGLDELKPRILPWLEKLDNMQNEAVVDYKTILQEKTQVLPNGKPIYNTLKQEGPSHCPVFTVEVIVSDCYRAVGTGSSIKDAGQNAAKNLLDIMEKENP